MYYPLVQTHTAQARREGPTARHATPLPQAAPGRWGPDGIAVDPQRELVCPKCTRWARVNRHPDFRINIEHTCPGPWILAGVRWDPGAPLGSWSATFHSFTPEELRMYAKRWDPTWEG